VTRATARYDVAVIGAGPTGLTVAGILAMHGHRVAILEARPELIDYPRGVGIDDETLRTFQAMGVVDEVRRHIVPNQIIIYVDKNGAELARMAPKLAPYGWPRRNGFIQPLVDAALLEHLQKFDNVDILWSHEATSLVDNGDSVTIEATSPAGPGVVNAAYLVGCDGGRSVTRKLLDIAFPGMSSSTSWVVVDLKDDPVGTPNCYVGCDPNRPYISIGLPHSIRRFEFMLLPGDSQHMDEDPVQLRRLMAEFIPLETEVEILRARVYTHHARVASSFVHGRVLLAGDAAHLMPVWQGQGYNTGNRDAANLGWKLDYVLRGLAGPGLLTTYDTERRPHAKAMVELSNATGRFLSPTNKLVAGARDVAAKGLGRLVPALRDFVTEMRFKPMPTYTDGAVYVDRDSRAVAGRLFIQPEVVTANGQQMRLDDVIGHRFAVLQWDNDPRRALDDETLERLRALDTRFVTVRSAGVPRNEITFDAGAEHVEVVDVDSRLRAWFDEHQTTVVFMRPDRIVAAASRPQSAAATFASLVTRMSLSPTPQPAVNV
jgi:3-(3-hydroxy-phenyl)propionate hydroxylase